MPQDDPKHHIQVDPSATLIRLENDVKYRQFVLDPP